MSWESRPRSSRRYYYRTLYANGRAIREYIGTGDKGEQAAADDQARRKERQAQAEQIKAEVRRRQEANEALGEWSDDLQQLAYAMLIADGCVYKNGEWKRARHLSDTKEGTDRGQDLQRRGEAGAGESPTG
jgi:hypothetical protein